MLGIDIFGVLTGALGLLSLLRAAWCRYTPARQVEALDHAVKTAEACFHSNVEQGLIPDEDYAAHVRERLFIIHCMTADLRAKALKASTTFQAVQLLIHGYTRKVQSLIVQVRHLRIELTLVVDYERFQQHAYSHLIKPSFDMDCKAIPPPMHEPPPCHLHDLIAVAEHRTYLPVRCQEQCSTYTDIVQ